ncbi:MAG TPA: ACT domain-containing protein [Roseiflexaceae bacterium]|nr:ACT domain-containing protein [Roseiflexaceae bacterium]
MTDFSADARLAEIVRTMPWRTRPERLALVGIDPREQPVALRLVAGFTGRLWQLTVEPEMVTLLLDEADWRQVCPAFPRARVERPYRAISFEVDLPPDLVGFLALLSGALAAAGVPLLAVSGFSRDHLIVREADLERAEAAIRDLVARV